MSSPSPSPHLFNLRPATLATSDPSLLLDLQDSQIPWLASIGSGAQWGMLPTREANPSAIERPRAWIERSERREPWASGLGDVGGDWCRAWIAETGGHSDGEGGVLATPLAALVLDSKAPAYAGAILPEQDPREPFVYLACLLANRRAGEASKGGGAALIAFSKERAREVGVRRLCLDCWAGNGRGLVRYYESQGFVSLGDFTVAVPGKNDWHGCVLEMRV